MLRQFVKPEDSKKCPFCAMASTKQVGYVETTETKTLSFNLSSQRKPLADSNLVFAHPNGRPPDLGVGTYTLAKVIAKAGLPHICFYDLRHAHATLMLKLK